MGSPGFAFGDGVSTAAARRGSVGNTRTRGGRRGRPEGGAGHAFARGPEVIEHTILHHDATYAKEEALRPPSLLVLSRWQSQPDARVKAASAVTGVSTVSAATTVVP